MSASEGTKLTLLRLAAHPYCSTQGLSDPPIADTVPTEGYPQKRTHKQGKPPTVQWPDAKMLRQERHLFYRLRLSSQLDAHRRVHILHILLNMERYMDHIICILISTSSSRIPLHFMALLFMSHWQMSTGSTTHSGATLITSEEENRPKIPEKNRQRWATVRYTDFHFLLAD